MPRNTKFNFRGAAANTALVLGSVLASVFIAELALRYVPQFRPKLEHPLYNVQKDKPIALIPNSKSHYQSTEFDFEFTANKFGRRDSEWTPQETKSVQNIIMVGDSFVFGYGVRDADTVPRLLESIYASRGENKRVFNFGMPGQIGLPEYRLLIEESENLGIKGGTIIVGVFIGNDIISPPEPSEPAGPTPPTVSGPLVHTSRLLYFLKREAAKSLILTKTALSLGRLVGDRMYASPSNEIFRRNLSPAAKETYRRVMLEAVKIRELSESIHKDVHFVIFPNLVQVQAFEAMENFAIDPAAPDKAIMEACVQYSLSCLDLLPFLKADFDEKKIPLFFPEDRHMNPQGNQIAAQMIHQFLAKKGRSRNISGNTKLPR